MSTGLTHLSGGSLSPEVPAVLAEGWKEANIRMGLLRLGDREGQSSHTQSWDN